MLIFCSRRIASNGSRRARYVVVVSQSNRNFDHFRRSRSEDPVIIIRVDTFDTFELTQRTRSGTSTPRTGRQTNGQIDGQLTIAIPRFVLRASRGKTMKDER